MHASPLSLRSSLRSAVLAAALLFSSTALAGPPLLCHPFDTAGAASLPWGRGWNAVDPRYETARLATDTLGLLGAGVPVIARMETLRRAAIYASANAVLLRDLVARLDARVAAAGPGQARAMALFDAGYFAETLQDIARLQGYDMPGVGKVDLRAVNAVLARGDGSVRIAEAMRLRPDDAGLHFASALVASADRRSADYARMAGQARAAASNDPLVARNLDKLGG